MLRSECLVPHGLRRVGRRRPHRSFPPPAAAAADPNKVIRWFFPTGENGLRSRTGLRSLFRNGHRGDLRAAADLRLPRAAGEARADGRRGDARGHRRRQDLHVQASARASTSRPIPRSRARSASSPPQDFVYSFMRFVDPKNRSPYAFLLEGKIEGLDELAAKAKKTGKFDYDAKVAGHGGRRLATRCASGSRRPTTTFLYVVAHALVRRGGARGRSRRTATTRWRIRWAPAPYMLKSWTRAREDRARGQSRLPRLRLGLPADRTIRGTRRSSRR